LIPRTFNEKPIRERLEIRCRNHWAAPIVVVGLIEHFMPSARGAVDQLVVIEDEL
jgi:hypothetical protein